MATWDYEIFWKETLNQIRNELEEQEFAMWFNLEYHSSTENEITLWVPSSFYRDQVKQRYQSYIEEKLHELTGKNLSIQFEVKPRKQEQGTPESKAPSKPLRDSPANSARPTPRIVEEPKRKRPPTDSYEGTTPLPPM